MTPQRWRPLPLALLAGGGTALATVLSVAVATGALALAGDLDRTAVDALVLSAVCGLVPAMAAAWGGQRVAALLRRLEQLAVRRLTDSTRPLPSDGHLRGGAAAAYELSALARAFDALLLRVQVADQLAERSRRRAETTSAGMYELLSGLVAAEEGTRGQLSAELHDTVAQSLMLARTMLGDVMGMAEATRAPVPPQLQRATDYVAEAEEQVRAVMARTRPPALRDGDLARAVAVLRDDMAARYGLQVEVAWPEDPQPLALVPAITVYRFYQEALVNVVKHADVDTARLRLDVVDDDIVASVTDDGPGFDPETVRPEQGRHVGLGLLRERVRLAGGSVQIDSARGVGTRLTLRLPRTAIPARNTPSALLLG